MSAILSLSSSTYRPSLLAPHHRASYPYTAPSRPSWGPSSAVGLAGLFKQLDISHGGPGDERPEGGVFFGAFLFDCFYGDPTGVVVDQPSVEAAPAPEPHGYSLCVPLLRQIPGQHASPVRLRSPGILPLYGPAPPGLEPVKRRQARYKPALHGVGFGNAADVGLKATRRGPPRAPQSAALGAVRVGVRPYRRARPGSQTRSEGFRA